MLKCGLKKLKDEVCVIIAVRNYYSIKSQLEKMNIADIYVATVNQFCFKTSYDYSGNTEKLINMKQNIFKLLTICEDDKSKQICSEVLQKWFDEENKSITYDEHQYFTKDIIHLSDEEIFVDIGAFDGDTIDIFLNHCKQKFRAVHAFELNKQVYSKLCEKVNQMSEEIRNSIHLYPMGIWNEEQTIT